MFRKVFSIVIGTLFSFMLGFLIGFLPFKCSDTLILRNNETNPSSSSSFLSNVPQKLLNNDLYGNPLIS